MTIFATSTSAFFDRGTLDLTSLRAQAEQLQSQVGSGEKLTKSSDDPLTASRLRNLSRVDSLAKIDTAAAGRATADLNLADSAMGEFANYITRAQELATQAANGTLTDSQRKSIGGELSQIHGNLVALANTRDSAGHALFGGDTAGNAYQLDSAGNASYIGTGSAGELALGDGQTVSRSFTGPEFLQYKSGGATTDLMTTIKGLADALSAGGTAAASAANAALTSLGDGLDAVTTAQTVLGTRLSWIDLNTQRQQVMGESRSEEQSQIGATDLTEALSRLSELSTVLQASQQSFAKLASLSLFDVLK
ncbi:flagellin [Novosphingobium sp. KCTC 2891]|uniref:flagellin N-terminal helical domain-containing protein n=1 Tax=Novosphingobium sp. KCTC 2891 TaxID=2989730 RepID=UPI002222391A|nr:flagellin [Novosphingobium sp. KCTC 2891]MCW1383000.1 flagellin [Novosphingobium sp. KCTC 2891]